MSCPIGPGRGGADKQDRGPGTGGYDDTGFGDELLAKLTRRKQGNGRPKLTPLKTLVPDEIFITDRVIDFSHRVGPATEEEAGRFFEVGGFYFADLDENAALAHDVIVPRDLPVAPGHIDIDVHYDNTARELRGRNEESGRRDKVVMMFHVHPGKGKPWHSSMDDTMLESLVTKMSTASQKVYRSPFQLIQEDLHKELGKDQYCFSGAEASDAIAKIIYPHDDAFFGLLEEMGMQIDRANVKKADVLARLVELMEVSITEPRLVTYSPSLVFNNHRSRPYVKIGIREFFPMRGKNNYDWKDNERDSVKIKVVQKGRNLYSDDEISAIVKERVQFPWMQLEEMQTARDRRLGQGYHGWTETMSGLIIPNGNGGGPMTLEDAFKEANGMAEASDDRIYQNGGGRGVCLEFVHCLIDYVDQYANVDCMYSEYGERLLDAMDPSRHEDANATLPLRHAVQSLGAIEKDPENPFVPNDSPRDARWMALTAMDAVNQRRDNATYCFMMNFLNGDTVERNTLLEEYVGVVLKDG